MQRRGHGPRQRRSLALQVHLGVDLADEIWGQGLQVHPPQGAGQGGAAAGLMSVEAECAAAELEPQPGGAVGSGQADLGRLQGVEFHLPELARAAERGLHDARGLLVDARSRDGDRALGGVGVGGQLERQSRQRALAGEMAAADGHVLAAEDGGLGGEIERSGGLGAVGDLQAAGDLALGQDRARADGQLQVGAGRRLAPQGQRAHGLDPRRVSVEAREVHAIPRQHEAGLAAGGSIVAVARDRDVAGKAPGSLGQGQLHLRAGERQVGGVDLAE